MLPAFLLSRKQKSLEYFFSLMRVYVEEDVSLWALWANKDKEAMFKNIKTLYRYHRELLKQVDEIFKTLSRELVTVDGNFILPDVYPGRQSSRDKIRLLLFLLDKLIEILHKKQRSGIILQAERYSFLHSYLNQKAGIVFLNSS